MTLMCSFKLHAYTFWSATVTNYLGVWVDLKGTLDVEVKIHLQIVKGGL
jgi:hypothetical protein